MTTIQSPFVSSILPPAGTHEAAYWFLFQDSRLLIYENGPTTAVPRLMNVAELGLPIAGEHYLGYLQDAAGPIHCYAAELNGITAVPDGMALHGLRRLYGALSDDLFWTAGRAVQIVDWDRTHQFCGRCGSRTENQPGERAKRCPQCGLSAYPRVHPAIIIAVERPSDEGNQLLLARNHRYPPGLYSVLAGFVEPGETLEGCARREVEEEVGIQIKNLCYFGSQPWPFPHSLMVAFTAEYASGGLTVQETELEEAAWFTVDKMPLTPASLSISSQLIAWFINKNSSRL